MLRKTLLILVLAATALASVSITSTEQSKTVAKPDLATFSLQLNGTGYFTFGIDTPLDVSFSQKTINLTGTPQTVLMFVLTKFVDPGVYIITFKATDESFSTTSYKFFLEVEEGTPDLMISPVYSRISALQGEQAKLSFIVRNEANQEVRNVILHGDISDKFNPVYPEVFDLEPRESKTVDVHVTIPQDYPAGKYKFTVSAALGSLEHDASTELVVKKRAEVAGTLTAELLLPWEPLKRNGETVGYTLFLRVKNQGSMTMDGAEVVFQGFPPGWAFSGDTRFSIRPFDVRDLALNIEPNGDFSEHTGDIVLVKDLETITRAPVTLAGFKVGVSASGLATLGGLGGSLTVGVLFVVVIVLVLLFVRQRNKKTDRKEDDHIKQYLESLVSKAKGEMQKEAKPVMPAAPVQKPAAANQSGSRPEQRAKQPEGDVEEEISEVTEEPQQEFEEFSETLAEPAAAEPESTTVTVETGEESPTEEEVEELSEEPDEDQPLARLVKKASQAPRRRVVRRVVRRKVRGRK
ncbi:hypothetical protein HYS54_01890 [Candidatus Micrarchaeota archaeon]|nr:hypothetical protein [Candidatus Micrarchaeota archaeon]